MANISHTFTPDPLPDGISGLRVRTSVPPPERARISSARSCVSEDAILSYTNLGVETNEIEETISALESDRERTVVAPSDLR